MSLRFLYLCSSAQLAPTLPLLYQALLPELSLKIALLLLVHPRLVRLLLHMYCTNPAYTDTDVVFVSVCSKCSRLQQPSQHISDEPELQHPARLLDTVDSAARTRDAAALFSRSRGCCDCSKTQTHPESRWVRVTCFLH